MGGGQRDILLGGDDVHQIDGAYAGKLLHELTDRWNCGFLPSIVIAVDAGVDARGKNGVRQYAEQCAATGIVKQMNRNLVGTEKKHDLTENGECDGEYQTGNQVVDGARRAAFSIEAGGNALRNIFGDGGLDACKGDGIAERDDRKNELVKTERRCTNGAREEYPI